MALANRIADIVDPDLCFGDFGASPVEQLRSLSQLARIRLDELTEIEQRPHSLILAVRCQGRAETLRQWPPADWFPPDVFIAYLNAKLADAGRSEELVACNDRDEETVALCTPAQAAELRAAIFARISELRWPRAQREPIEDELLAAIRATPADDGPRLVYADWLIERQDPRGEFIMWQCNGMHERADVLRRVHWPAWAAHLPPWARNPWFERGFISRVEDENGRRIAVEPQLDALV